MRHILFLLLVFSLLVFPWSLGAQGDVASERSGMDALNAARQAEASGRPMEALFLAGKAVGFSTFVNVTDEAYPPMLAEGTAEYREAREIIARNSGFMQWSSPVRARQSDLSCYPSYEAPCPGWVMSWSPDNRLLAAGRNSDLAFSVWDSHDGTLLKTFAKPKHDIRVISWSPDGERLVTIEDCYTNEGEFSELLYSEIEVWDFSTGLVVAEINIDNRSISEISWSNDSKLIAVSSNTTLSSHDPGAENYHGMITIHDVSTGDSLSTLIGFEKYIKGVSWNPNGDQVAFWTNDHASILDLETGDLIQTLQHSNDVIELAWSNDGELIAGSNHSACIWDSKSGEIISCLQGDIRWIDNLTWSTDGKSISGCDPICYYAWNVENGAVITQVSAELSESSISIYNGLWKPDGSLLALVDLTGYIIFWDPLSQIQRPALQGYFNDVTDIDWRPNGTQIVTGGRDKALRIYNARNGSLLDTLLGHIICVQSVAWSPDGNLIASEEGWHRSEYENPNDPALMEFGIYIWDADNSTLLCTLNEPQSEVLSLAWSPDSSRIAAGKEDTAVDIFDIETGEQIQTLYAVSPRTTKLSWSPDGRNIAASGWDTVSILNVADGSVAASFPSQWNPSWCPDGSRVATAGHGNAIYIWSREDGSLLDIVRISGFARSLGWSPDGTRIAAITDSGLEIYGANSGDLQLALPSFTGPLEKLVWSPDGAQIVTSGTSVIVWDIAGHAQGRYSSDILHFVLFNGTSVRFAPTIGDIGEVLTINRQ